LSPISPHFYQPLILAQKVCDEETEEVIYICGRSHGRAFQESTKISMEQFEACDGVYTFFFSIKMCMEVEGGAGGTLQNQYPDSWSISYISVTITQKDPRS
jgi:hypothetical protein